MALDNSKILIVGGAGFVGSNLTHHLLKSHEPDQIWIVDNLLSADSSNIGTDSRIKFLAGSITDDLILAQLPSDLNYVFHLACYHGNQSSIADPIADHDNNTFTTLKLLEAIKGFQSLECVVYAAAGCAVAEKTFDNAKPVLEDAPVSLFHDSPYSISKLVGEMYGNYYFERYGLPFVKARFQNVYGPGEILGAGDWRGTVHTIWRNVIPTFIWRALHKESLPLDNAGQGSRDFIYVEDLVRGLVLCATQGIGGQAYNLASGVETNILSLANCINRIADNETAHDMKPARDWDRSGCRFGSTDKSRRELDFFASVTLEEGIQKTVDWARENRTRIAEIMARHSEHLPNVTTYLQG